MGRVLIPYRHEHKVTPYVAAVRLGGAEGIAISVAERPQMREFQGLLLTGGTDINPKLYGQEAVNETDAPDDLRDEVEYALMGQALDQDVPILAICRGLQLLNVYHGGTLHQHLGNPEHDVESENKGAIAHAVVLEPESHLAKVFGETILQVNSRHHQAVDRLGNGLRISARDASGGAIVEGLEQPTRRFVLAVQWHPEDQVTKNEEQLRLFRRFAEATRSNSGARRSAPTRALN